MAQKIQDITSKAEQPQNIIKPEVPMQPEKPGQVEVEKKIEIETAPAEGAVETERHEAAVPAPTPAPPVKPLPEKSPTLEKIENILQEDLQDIYFQLPPNKQEEFREVGEETATKIEQMISGVKVKVKKILELIIHWLRIIPGLNRYFLEQEAKIKTDEILKLKKEQKEEKSWDPNKI